MHAHPHAHLDVTQHARHALLHQLERAERRPKLLALAHVPTAALGRVASGVIWKPAQLSGGDACTRRPHADSHASHGNNHPALHAHLATMSYAPMLMPTGSHATMMRLSASTLLVSWNELTPARGSARLRWGGVGCVDQRWRVWRRARSTVSCANAADPIRRPRQGRPGAASGPASPGVQPRRAPVRRTRQPRAVGHEAALEHHVCVLHAAQRDLVLNLGRAEAGRALLDDEAVDLRSKERWRAEGPES